MRARGQARSPPWVRWSDAGCPKVKRSLTIRSPMARRQSAPDPSGRSPARSFPSAFPRGPAIRARSPRHGDRPPSCSARVPSQQCFAALEIADAQKRAPMFWGPRSPPRVLGRGREEGLLVRKSARRRRASVPHRLAGSWPRRQVTPVCRGGALVDSSAVRASPRFLFRSYFAEVPPQRTPELADDRHARS